MFNYISCEERVPLNHPLRSIQATANKALKELSPVTREMYSQIGRSSIARLKLLRSLLFQILYFIRSERLLVDQFDHNLLFCWFVGLSLDELIWNHSFYSKNRGQVLSTEVAELFLKQITRKAEEEGLLANEHFTVDRTLIDSWASLKSLRLKDTNSSNHCGATRKPETGFWLMLGPAWLQVQQKGMRLFNDRADSRSLPNNSWADKEYDTKDFVKQLCSLNTTPHVAQKKSLGFLKKSKYRVEEKIVWLFTFTAAAYKPI